jgi:hypothetical protein
MVLTNGYFSIIAKNDIGNFFLVKINFHFFEMK